MKFTGGKVISVGCLTALLTMGTPIWAQPVGVVYDRIYADTFEQLSRRIVLESAPTLFTSSGQSSTIIGSVTEGLGKTVDYPITWTSSDPAAVSVTAEGVVTAHTDAGSATITGTAEGASESHLVIVVATPRSGTIVLDDEQIVGEPVPLSADETPEAGYLYELVVDSGSPLAIGDKILGSGLKPVAGRVTAVDDHSQGQLLTVSLTELDDLFDELQINEEVDLSLADIVLDDDVATYFDVIRSSTGAVFLRAKPDKSAIGTQAVFLKECESEIPLLDGVLGTVPTPEPSLNPSISFKIDFDVDTGLAELLALGNLDAAFDIKPRLFEAIGGKITCKARLFRIPIPIGGALSWFFGGFVPIGVGFELDAALTFPNLAQIGFDITVAGNAALRTGFECKPYCEVVADLEPPPSFQSTIKPVLPPIGADPGAFRLKLAGYGFGFADLTLGNPLLKALQFDGLSVTVGMAQSFDFQSRAAQAEDVGYASSFKLERKLDVSLNNKINQLLAKIGVQLPDFLLVEADVIAQSPKGTLIIRSPDGGSSDNPNKPATVTPGNDSELGELATFEVTLDPVSYLGLYSVKAIDLYRQTTGQNGETVLSPNRSPCATLFPQTPGQTMFTCAADFLEEDVGTNSIVAFVRAELFGFEIPVPLEITNDSRATVYVSPDGPPIVTSATVRLDGGCGGNVSVEDYDIDGESEYESDDYTGPGDGQGQIPSATFSQPGMVAVGDSASLAISLGAGEASMNCSGQAAVSLNIYTLPANSPPGTVVAEVVGVLDARGVAHASANPACQKDGDFRDCAVAESFASAFAGAKVEQVFSGRDLDFDFVAQGSGATANLGGESYPIGSGGVSTSGPWKNGRLNVTSTANDRKDTLTGDTPGQTQAEGSFTLTLKLR